MIRWHAIRDENGNKDQYAIAGSMDGVDRYTIARVGTGDGTRYELWEGRHMASSHGAPDEARAHAETLASADVRRLSRATDPDTSRMAAERTTRSGKRQAGIRRVVAAVCEHPGATSAEVAQMIGMDRVEAARRLPDARDQGLIHNAVDARDEPIKRRCAVGGTLAIIWLPGAAKTRTRSQKECLEGAA